VRAQAIRHNTPLTVNGAVINTGTQPDTNQVGYCNSLLHRSHTSSIQTLQHVQNNAARIISAPRTSTTAPAPLAAGSSQNEQQAGCDDLQDPQHRFTGISQLSRQTSQIIRDPTAHCTFHQDCLRSVLSDAQLCLSGTHYLHSSPTTTRWRPSNLG